jgi:hypothetical protein
MSLTNYMLAWTLTQHHALMYRDLYPDRVHIVRIEDVMRDPRGTLGALCETIGLERAESLSQVSWNGQPLTEVYPWGTIRAPTLEANLATARILSSAQTDEIRIRARGYLDTFDYTSFAKLRGRSSPARAASSAPTSRAAWCGTATTSTCCCGRSISRGACTASPIAYTYIKTTS